MRQSNYIDALSSLPTRSPTRSTARKHAQMRDQSWHPARASDRMEHYDRTHGAAWLMPAMQPTCCLTI